MGRSGQLYAKNDYLISELLTNPNYDVRSDGTIWTNITKTGKVSVTNIWRIAGRISDGYVEISFRSKKIRAHRVVYAKFVGPLSPDLVINHKDGVRWNNHPPNLELGTQSVNNYHRFRELKKPPVMGNVVLTWEIVSVIRMMYNSHVSLRRISNQFNISKGHASQIVNNKIWIPGKSYHSGPQDKSDFTKEPTVVE